MQVNGSEETVYKVWVSTLCQCVEGHCHWYGLVQKKLARALKHKLYPEGGGGGGEGEEMLELGIAGCIMSDI